MTLFFAPANTNGDDSPATDAGPGSSSNSTDDDSPATGEASTPSGSRGVSVTTADGVRATVQPAEKTTITLDGEETSFEPVAGVLSRLDVTARVALVAETPVGAGFGASGAATLATALAANAVFELGVDRTELLSASHRAEVAAGTGLGDVFVQAGGGMAYDTGTGRTRVSLEAELGYVSHGGIATEELLGDSETMARVRSAANDAFAAFDPSAELSETVRVARLFADRVGLVTDRVAESLQRVNRAGGVGTMAMVGETVVALDPGGVLPHRTRIASDGARIVTHPESATD